jgi:hypothetical protein
LQILPGFYRGFADYAKIALPICRIYQTVSPYLCRKFSVLLPFEVFIPLQSTFSRVFISPLWANRAWIAGYFSSRLKISSIEVPVPLLVSLQLWKSYLVFLTI